MYTAWKVSVFGVILVLIFPHLDWIKKNRKIWTRITPNTDTFYAVIIKLNPVLLGGRWNKINTNFINKNYLQINKQHKTGEIWIPTFIFGEYDSGMRILFKYSAFIIAEGKKLIIFSSTYFLISLKIHIC